MKEELYNTLKEAIIEIKKHITIPIIELRIIGEEIQQQVGMEMVKMKYIFMIYAINIYLIMIMISLVI